MPAQILDNTTAKTVLQIMNAEPRPSAPNNNSQQHLMNDETATRSPPITCKQKITVVILCFVNLINYMDRYTIAGNVPISHYSCSLIFLECKGLFNTIRAKTEIRISINKTKSPRLQNMQKLHTYHKKYCKLNKFEKINEIRDANGNF